jgi:cyclo(L-tyrosyl-L-tyrosyl) synthase
MGQDLKSAKFINTFSENLFNLRSHALIGVSPFNSYFSKETLTELFSWALKMFKDINIFIPNEISSYTFEALGYDKNKALKKTRSQDRYLKNKTLMALMVSGLNENEAVKKIVFFTDISKNEKYISFYNTYKDLYETDKNFRNGCLLTSKWVLEGKCDLKTIDEKALGIAVQYFLAELPLFLNSPEILNLESSLFVYKDTPEFVNRIYNDNLFSYLPSKSQGYMTINLTNTGEKI